MRTSVGLLERRHTRRTATALGLVLLGGSGCLTGKSSIGTVNEDNGATSGATSSGSDDAPGVSTDSPTGESGGDASDGTASTGEPEATAGTGPSLACPAHSTCSTALDCSDESYFHDAEHECGQLLSWADENGCPRPFCESTDDCPDGHSCNFAYQWGDCGPDPCGDSEQTGLCDCPFVGLNCPTEGVCVSDDVYPPPGMNRETFCAMHTDEATCNDVPEFNGMTCLWAEGLHFADAEACGEGVPVSRCVPSGELSRANDCPTDDSLHPHAREEDGGVTIFYAEASVLLFAADESSGGWAPCGLWAEEDIPQCACACP